MPAFRTEIEVRFGDCDPAGIVYFPTLYHYCHVAFEDTWRRGLRMPYAALVSDQRLGFPTVHVETDFRSPARYGDIVEMDVRVERIGESSVVFRFEGRVGDRVVFQSTHTTVCVDLDSLASVPVPRSLREALLALHA